MKNEKPKEEIKELFPEDPAPENHVKLAELKIISFDKREKVRKILLGDINETEREESVGIVVSIQARFFLSNGILRDAFEEALDKFKPGFN